MVVTIPTELLATPTLATPTVGLKTLTNAVVPAGISSADVLPIPMLTEVAPTEIIGAGLLKNVPTPIEEALPTLNSRILKTLFLLSIVITVAPAATVVVMVVSMSYDSAAL